MRYASKSHFLSGACVKLRRVCCTVFEILVIRELPLATIVVYLTIGRQPLLIPCI